MRMKVGRGEAGVRSRQAPLAERSAAWAVLGGALTMKPVILRPPSASSSYSTSLGLVRASTH
jgi:hypothetical protein